MLKNTINWGSVMLGAALVTGIAAAVAFIPALAAGGLAAAATNMSAAVGGGAIGSMISTAVTFIGEHWAATLGVGAMVGAASGLIAPNLTNREDVSIDIAGGAAGLLR